MRYFLVFLVIVVVVFFLFESSHGTLHTSISPTITSSPSGTGQVVLGEQTKTTDCIIRGPLQDTACTPGSIFTTVTTEQVCTPGYSKSVRNVSVATKKQVYEEYGILSHKAGEYEVDHLISLELGGSNDIANLWPEAADPRPGFHEKDAVENYLHDEVCAGKISLQEAQKEIASNWLEVYKSIPDPQSFEFNGSK